MPFHLADGKVVSPDEGLPTPSVGPIPPVFTPYPVTGNPGVSAYTRVQAAFTMPAANSTVDVSVMDSSWMGVDQPLFIETAGSFLVSGINGKTSITIENTGASENASSGTSISAGVKVSPSGRDGTGGGGGGGDTGVFVVTLNPNTPMVVPAGQATIVFQGTLLNSDTYTIVLEETEAFAPKLLDFSNCTIQEATILIEISGMSDTQNSVSIVGDTNPGIFYNLVYWDGNGADEIQTVPVISGAPDLGGIPSPPAYGVAISYTSGAMNYGDSISNASAVQFTGSFQGGETYTITFNPSFDRFYELPMVLDFSNCTGSDSATVTVGCPGTSVVDITPGGGSGFIPYYLLYWDGNSGHPPVLIPVGSSSVDAANVTYTPSDAGDWTSPPPTRVGPALDLLATAVNAGSLTSNKYDVAANRGSASGSGKLFICRDAPVMYFDDPNTSAWITIPLESSYAAIDPSSYVTAPTGGITLAPYGEALRALVTSFTSVSLALVQPSAGLLSPTACWCVTLVATYSPMPFQDYPDFGVCVTDGIADNSNVYAISSSTNGSTIYFHQQNLLVNSVTRNQNNGEVSGTPPWFMWGNGRVHFRILNDGTSTHFQISSDRVQWQNWNTPTPYSNTAYYGFYFASRRWGHFIRGGNDLRELPDLPHSVQHQ